MQPTIDASPSGEEVGTVGAGNHSLLSRPYVKSLLLLGPAGEQILALFIGKMSMPKSPTET